MSYCDGIRSPKLAVNLLLLMFRPAWQVGAEAPLMWPSPASDRAAEVEEPDPAVAAVILPVEGEA